MTEGRVKEENMGQHARPAIRWKDEKVSVRVKLSALWIGVMFLYIYADIKALFETGIIEQIMAGEIMGMAINQAFLLYSAILMSIPPVMAFLSLILKPAVNRIVNMVLGILHILLAIGILFGPGEPWAYYYWYTALEVGFHLLIVLHAIRWPRA
jgi:hypothetical protein